MKKQLLLPMALAWASLSTWAYQTVPADAFKVGLPCGNAVLQWELNDEDSEPYLEFWHAASVENIDLQSVYGVPLDGETMYTTVTTIHEWAFNNVPGIKRVTLPISVTSMGDYTFAMNTGIEYVKLPDRLNAIPTQAFYNCTGLTEVIIPQELKSIGYAAFGYCSALTHFEIPETVNTFGQNTFENCTSLQSVVFKGNAPYLSAKMFSGCISLTSLTFEGATVPTVVASDAFSGVDKANLTIYVPTGTKAAYASALGVPASQVIDGTEGQEPEVDQNVYITVNASTGKTYRDNAVSTSWCSKWVSNLDESQPTFVIENKNGNAGKLCQPNSGVIDFRGWGTDENNRYWYLKVENPKYYVSAITFRATGQNGVKVNGEDADGTVRTYTYEDNNTAPTIAIDKNAQCLFYDFVVTLTPRSFYVEPDSWYVIKSLTVAANNLAGLSPNGVYRHSNGDYSMAWLPFTGEDYSNVSPDCYVHVEDVYKPNGYMIIRSNNGMYMNPDCTADREPQQTKLQMITLPETVRIGGTWSTFTQSASAENVITTSVTGLGQSGSAANNFIMTKVNPRERFDIYTVNILRVEDVYEQGWDNGNDKIKHDVQLTMKTNSQGYNKVYNGGVFFVNKDYVPVYDDFEAEENLGNAIPEITIDPVNFTITVDYNKMHGQEMDWEARLTTVKGEKESILNSAINHLVTTLNLKTAEELRQLWNDIHVTITDEMTDDEKFVAFEEAEHQVDHFLSVTASNLYAQYLNGKKVKMHTTRDLVAATGAVATTNHKYLKGVPSAQLTAAATTALDVQCAWVFEMDDNYGMKLHNLAADQYVSMGSANDNQATLVAENAATTFNIEFILDTHPGYAAIVVANSSNGIHLPSDNNIRSWSKTAAANQWLFELISDEDEQAFIDAAQARMATVTAALPSTTTITNTRSYAGKTQYFGDQPSQFSFTLAASNYPTVKANADVLSLENMDYPNCYAATVFPTTNLYTLNPVEPGHFVRIKSWNYNEDTHVGYTYSMAENNSLPCHWNNNDEGIFYFMPCSTDATKGYLISYLRGYAAKHYAAASTNHVNSSSSSIHLNARTSEAGNANIESYATKVWFTGAPAIHMNQYYTGDRYYVNFYNGTSTTVRYMYNQPGSNNAKVAPNGGENVTASSSAAYYTFSVEYVDKLPVTVHSGDNCGSIYLPVEVTVPSTHTVYIASEQSDNDGTYLKLTQSANGVVPAYTHAIISGNAGTVEVNVNYNAPAATPQENDYLHGHFAKIAIPSGDLVYLEKSSTAAQNAAMLLDAETASAKFVRADSSIPANAMVIKANESALTNNTLSVPLTEDESAYLTKAGTTTGINRVVVEMLDGNHVVYDLQGRRLSEPRKGAVNIVNGKKIFVY